MTIRRRMNIVYGEARNNSKEPVLKYPFYHIIAVESWQEPNNRYCFSDGRMFYYVTGSKDVKDILISDYMFPNGEPSKKLIDSVIIKVDYFKQKIKAGEVL